MNRFFASFIVLLALSEPLVKGESLLKPLDSVIIAGDSITEQKIYSVDLEDYLLMCQPVMLKRVVQLGWNGEQAGGFLGRLDSDLYPFHPSVVTTCYGMNDGRYTALTPEIAGTYERAQTAIVESLKTHGVRVIVLGSSKCVDSYTFRHTNPTQATVYNENLAALSEIDRRIAQKEGVLFADVYDATFSTMKKAKAAYGESYVFGGPDGVHPGPNGHLVMAYAFLKALGCDGVIGKLTVHMDSHLAEGSPGQKIVSFQNGVLRVESSRYPFCFQGEANKPEPTEASILKFVPFNEDLNRYLLVVDGLTSAQAKVTWGMESKEFSAHDLEKGINLAAEFLRNPFVEPFGKVNAAVQAEQDFDTPLVKQTLHNLEASQNADPGNAAALKKAAMDGVLHSETLFHEAAALVTPVQHQLTIQEMP